MRLTAIFLAAAILGVDITEVYSPERVAKVAAKKKVSERARHLI